MNMKKKQSEEKSGFERLFLFGVIRVAFGWFWLGFLNSLCLGVVKFRECFWKLDF